MPQSAADSKISSYVQVYGKPNPPFKDVSVTDEKYGRGQLSVIRVEGELNMREEYELVIRPVSKPEVNDVTRVFREDS